MRKVRKEEEIVHDIEVGSKVCSRCEQRKDFSEFSKDKRMRDGKMVKCKTCMAEVKKEQREARSLEENQRLARKYNLKKCYGISLEDYDKMFTEQDGKCAICGSRDSKSGRSDHLFVDHCHTTGKVRALLCGNCNTALGKVEEDERIVLAMLAYIRSNNE